MDSLLICLVGHKFDLVSARIYPREYPRTKSCTSVSYQQNLMLAQLDGVCPVGQVHVTTAAAWAADDPHDVAVGFHSSELDHQPGG